jgi:hypothetical protein
VPAVRLDAGDHRTNQKAFFNSIVAAYKGWNDSRNRGDRAILLGNDTYLNPDDINHVASIMQDISVSIPWSRGDVLMLDNRVVM